MSSVLMLPIRFGYSTSRELTPESRELSDRVINEYYSKDASRIFLQIEWISRNNRISREAFATRVIGALQSIEANQCLLIDIGGWNCDDAVDPEIYYGLLEILKSSKAKEVSHFLIILPGGNDSQSPEAKAIREMSANPKVELLLIEDYQRDNLESLAGAAIKLTEESIKVARIRTLYNQISQNIVAKYEKTVVRVPGYFSDEPQFSRYAFSFDFSGGSQFAIQLCYDKLHQLYQRGINHIYYWGGKDWFEKVVQESAHLTKLDFTLIPIYSFDAFDFDDKLDCEYALLVPVVRTGRQFSKLLSSTSRLPSQTWCLGTIANGNSNFVDIGVRKIWVDRDDGERVPLDVDFEICKQVESDKVSEIWASITSFASVKAAQTAKYKLSATAAWAMMLEVEFGPEEYGSEKRNFIRLLPKFTQIVSKNMTYLAALCRNVIGSVLRRPFAESDLILCVDEAAASALSQRIVGGAYAKSIAVSRKLLKSFGSESRTEDLPDENLEAEIAILKERVHYARSVVGFTGTRDIPALIIDESTVSGDTISSLSRVAKAIGLDVQGAFVIMQFCQDLPQTDFPVVPLYKIPIGEHYWKE